MACNNLDDYAQAIRTQDTHKRLKLAIELGSYLKNPSSSVADYEQLVDGLVSWTTSSNFKVSFYPSVLIKFIFELNCIFYKK